MDLRRTLVVLATTVASFLAGCTNPLPPAEPPAPVVRIHDIQGAAHRSPLEGRTVTAVPGVVTALSANGFYFEDPLPDADPATSEGVFVHTETTPTVAVGQFLLVSGSVREYRPGAASGGAANLTTTEIAASTIAPGGTPPAPLPPPVVIGARGRTAPTGRIAGPTSEGSVESAGYMFDPATNAIDFYESLEGMRVVVDDAVAVGPTSSKHEIPVVAESAVRPDLRSPRGGVVIAPNDFHPERLLLADTLLGHGELPNANVGDRLTPVEGVIGYSFGNFKLLLTRTPRLAPGGITRQTTALQADATHLTLASFNVENLAATAPPTKFAALGRAVATNLRAPDIVALMEIQDDDGATDDGVVDAAETLQKLVDAIHRAGGPVYAWRQIDPVANRDGGQPGGNIRQVLLFNPARVSFVDRRTPADPSSTAVSAIALSPGVRLSASPGRIAPGDPAFTSSRKPLVAEFRFAGSPFFVIANHLNSKGGDGPLFGRFQPPVLTSESQRLRQADLIAGFASSLKAIDRDARIIVLGDLNDFPFSPPLARLKRAGFIDLIDRLPANQRYSYVYEGNSQAIDHILLSENLAGEADYDIVHLNAEFFDQISDHDPEVARLAIGRRQ